MPRTAFRSKIDWSLLVALSVSLSASTVVCAILAIRFSDPIGWLVVVLILGADGFVVWIYRATRYVVGDSQLSIQSGPFSWKIPVDDIRSVVPSGSALSSPALSLDRLEVRYAADRSLLVSPDRREQFLEALARESSGLSLGANGLQRVARKGP